MTTTCSTRPIRTQWCRAALCVALCMPLASPGQGGAEAGAGRIDRAGAGAEEAEAKADFVSTEAEADVASTEADVVSTEADANRELWANADPVFAFLMSSYNLAEARADEKRAGPQGELAQDMLRNWGQFFLRRVMWKGRLVIDVGCASGLLGEWALGSGHARHYVAVDITDRALETTRRRLARYREGRSGDFSVALAPPMELCELTRTCSSQTASASSILVSTKVIQHLPSIDAIKRFLHGIRRTRVEHVVIQVVESIDTHPPDSGLRVFRDECIGGLQDYANSDRQRTGHFCRVTALTVETEMAAVAGGASYVLEWSDREPLREATNLWMVFRRSDVRPDAYPANSTSLRRGTQLEAGKMVERVIVAVVAGAMVLLPMMRRRTPARSDEADTSGALALALDGLLGAWRRRLERRAVAVEA